MSRRTLTKAARQAIDQLALVCDAQQVIVYGPYPPSAGRQRWRLVVYAGGLKRKSVTAPDEASALLLKESLESEVARVHGCTAAEAIESYITFKEAAAGQKWRDTLKRRLSEFFPADLLMASITPALAREMYEGETRRITATGRVVATCSHHHLLRNVKEFFGWLVKRGQCAANPFAEVEPIGRVHKGKAQLRETEAAKLDQLLFDEARAGNEGALALLVQLFGAFRSSEVLRLVVSDVEFLPTGKARVHVKFGKTDNATRSVDLHESLTELLQAKCSAKATSERIFAANLPKVPAPDWLYKRLKVFCKVAGIPAYCPHSLRGYHASSAISAGVSSDAVAKTLGHGSFEVTKRHYATASSLQNAKARQVADKLKAGQKPSLSAAEKAELLRYLSES